MNFLKKIDHYFLTNHPVLWRTKVHYFVLFSLVLGNVLAFGLGYFLIKSNGVSDLGFVSVSIWIVIVFGILMWLVSQARNKIKQYWFRDELLTFLIYVFCTASLLGNLMFFERTITRTTAHLVSVEQVDIDKEILKHTIKNDYGYYFSEPDRISYPGDDVVMEMTKRYRVHAAFGEDMMGVNIDEISDKVNRIYGSQLSMGMRVERPSQGVICGFSPYVIYTYSRHIILLLCVPVFLFLISHTNLRNILLIAVISSIIGMISGILGFITAGVFPIILYMILWGIALQENGQVSRMASLLIIPCTLLLTWIFSQFLFMILNVDEIFPLVLRLIFTITTTALASAYSIKRYFDPIV